MSAAVCKLTDQETIGNFSEIGKKQYLWNCDSSKMNSTL